MVVSFVDDVWGVQFTTDGFTFIGLCDHEPTTNGVVRFFRQLFPGSVERGECHGVGVALKHGEWTLHHVVFGELDVAHVAKADGTRLGHARFALVHVVGFDFFGLAPFEPQKNRVKRAVATPCCCQGPEHVHAHRGELVYPLPHQLNEAGCGTHGPYRV